MPLIKLVVLGAAGCGKTSLIKQFVQHDFDEFYGPTKQKQIYYPSILMDERLYELQIIDLPPITFVPRNSYEEWNDFRGFGLRNAHAYLLVFDISCSQSFQCVKSLRDQLCAIKGDPLIVIAGNKQDLLLQDHDRNFNINNNVNGSCNTIDSRTHQRHHHNGSSAEIRHGETNKEFATIARKQWKCSYVECSAKFNWRITAVFIALMKAIDRNDDILIKKQGTPSVGNHNRKKCVIS